MIAEIFVIHLAKHDLEFETISSRISNKIGGGTMATGDVEVKSDTAGYFVVYWRRKKSSLRKLFLDEVVPPT